MTSRTLTRSAAAGALALVTLTTVGAAACPRPDVDPQDAPTIAAAPLVDRSTDTASRGTGRDLPPDPALPEATPAPVATAPAPAEPTPAPRPTPEATPDQGAPSAVGIPDGTALTPMAGGTVEASGEIANAVFDSDVVFTGSDLTLRNVRVNGEAIIRGDRVQVTGSEVAALSISGSDSVTITGTEVFGLTGRDGIHITSDTGPVTGVVIRDCLIHDPKVTATSHYDGIQVRGVDGLTLERVRIDLGAFVPQHNAALFLEDANGGNRNVTVTDSVLLGGGYTLYSFAGNVAITDSVLAGGEWGTLFPSSRTQDVVRFSGNTDDVGRPLRLLPGAIG